MYCPKCGKDVVDDAVICISCGRAINNNLPVPDTGTQKDWLTTLLLSLFLGVLGVHRFYTGHTGIGIAQLLTFGGCGIWSFIDFIMIVTNAYKDSNGQPLLRK